eukprot:s4210_g3.t5
MTEFSVFVWGNQPAKCAVGYGCFCAGMSLPQHVPPGSGGYPLQASWLAQPGHGNGVVGCARREHQVYDHKYILAEAERKKQEVDGGLAKQLAHIDLKYQEERGNILKQAGSHAQLAEKEVAAQAKERHAQLQRQEDIQAHAIGHEADAEKARLGHAAATAIAAHMEQQKARVHQEALREAEDMWRESQRALLEKAHKAKIEIELTAKRRTADIEEQVREALSRIYLSPHTSGKKYGSRTVILASHLLFNLSIVGSVGAEAILFPPPLPEHRAESANAVAVLRCTAAYGELRIDTLKLQQQVYGGSASGLGKSHASHLESPLPPLASPATEAALVASGSERQGLLLSCLGYQLSVRGI